MSGELQVALRDKIYRSLFVDRNSNTKAIDYKQTLQQLKARFNRRLFTAVPFDHP
jgi:hypothetical protein